MSKISIVGVDGSGKTVLMVAFGEKYERPDGYGYFLSANNPQTFHTVKMLMDRMRHGCWPNATGADVVTNLEWSLLQRQGKNSTPICAVSFLDYAGEIYRLAFGEHSEEERAPFKEQIQTLHNYISTSDAVLVLINLKDVISGDLSQEKTRETLWISRNIFDYATEKNPEMKIALAFSQFDVYRDEVEMTGGLQATYRKYLSHIESLYPEMQLLPVSAVNRTVVTAEGFEVPAEDFESEGLDAILEWIVSTVPGHGDAIANRRELPKQLWKTLTEGRAAFDMGTVKPNSARLQRLNELAGCLEELQALPEAERQTVATNAQCDEMKEFLAVAQRKCAAFEEVLDIARTEDVQVAASALESIAAREACSNEELEDIQNEIVAIIEAKKAAEKAAKKKIRRRRAVVTTIAAVLAVGATLGGVKLRFDDLKEKERAGYVVHYPTLTAKWVPGTPYFGNKDIVADKSKGKLKSKKPGYQVEKQDDGTVCLVWKKGEPYPGKEHIVSGETDRTWVSAKPGYVVSGEGEDMRLVWKKDETHPKNDRLVSTEVADTWKSKVPGWKWIGGAKDEWTPKTEYPGKSGIIAGETEGMWVSSKPGYVISGEGEDMKLVWKKGEPYPGKENIIAGTDETKWVSAKSGYVVTGEGENMKCEWRKDRRHNNDTNIVAGEIEGTWFSSKPGYVISGEGEDLKLVWKSDEIHPNNQYLVSTSEKDQWESTRPGWKWIGGAKDEWTPKTKHPDNENIIAGETEGMWVSAKPGYVVYWQDDKPSLVWKANQIHPKNLNIVSTSEKDQWESTRPGWRWIGGADDRWIPGTPYPGKSGIVAGKTKDSWVSNKTGYVVEGYGDSMKLVWKAGMKLDDYGYPHWVTVEEENSAKPAPGYQKKDKNVSGWGELVWTPGLIDQSTGEKRKAAQTEGSWLHQVDCGSCDGKGEKTVRVDCFLCDGSKRINGLVRCSTCDGKGEWTEDCPNSQAHNSPCPNCWGRGGVQTLFGWIKCSNCAGTGTFPCFTCMNQYRIQRSCSNCGGRGERYGRVRCSNCDGKGRVSSKETCSACGEDGCPPGKVWR